MNCANTNINRLLRFKNQIIPKEKSAEKIIETLIDKYTCVNITEKFLKTTRCAVFAENYLHKYGEHLNFSDVWAYEIQKDEASIELNAYDPDENVSFILENTHCYFETNSSELFDEIALLRSVSQYDYDNETEELFELLSRIEQLEEK